MVDMALWERHHLIFDELGVFDHRFSDHESSKKLADRGTEGFWQQLGCRAVCKAIYSAW